MRVIPAAVQTLLKSRAQAGANAHNHLITLTGAPSGASLLDPTAWTTWRTFVGSGETPQEWGNITATADGRAVCIYCEDGSVKLGYASSVPEVLNGTVSINTATATTLVSGLTGARVSIALIDGKLNVCITHVSTETVAEFWRDTDGNGTGMAKVSDISTDLSSNSSYAPAPGHSCSMIHRLGTSTLAVLVAYQYGISSTMRCCYSLDDGITWNQGGIAKGDVGVYNRSNSRSFLIFGTDSFITVLTGTDGSSWLNYWTDSGATVTRVDWTPDWDYYMNIPWHVAFVTVGNDVYMSSKNTLNIYVWRLKADTPAIGSIESESDWELLKSVDDDGQTTQHFFTLTSDTLILQHASDGKVSGAGTTLGDSIPLRAKRIEVTRNKGMASSATVVFDNKGGIYSPDKAEGADWKNVMFPNNGIKIEQGYGSELITTFTGTIDDVVMTTFPAEISLICRDYLKRAYDQLITSGGTHSITYANFTPEAMFAALAELAGWAAGDIHTEVTGLTIAEKIFSNETYGDAFSWLADMCGFMVWCDEDGDIYFYKDDDDAVPSSDYEFAEGEDIVSLGYTISDRDLYNKVIVVGDGVAYEATYVNTYGILAQKKMIIQASEATTEAQCQAIADQAVYVMNSRARICEFAAICNPYLQIGDTLTVTETTTLISELYKITDMSTSQLPDGGYIMHITCYHYAASAES